MVTPDAIDPITAIGGRLVQSGPVPPCFEFS